jgi:hypothetical protein
VISSSDLYISSNSKSLSSSNPNSSIAYVSSSSFVANSSNGFKDVFKASSGVIFSLLSIGSVSSKIPDDDVAKIFSKCLLYNSLS